MATQATFLSRMRLMLEDTAIPYTWDDGQLRLCLDDALVEYSLAFPRQRFRHDYDLGGHHYSRLYSHDQRHRIFGYTAAARESEPDCAGGYTSVYAHGRESCRAQQRASR